jgi:dTDP-4-dehydrorhamnose 3,5-epimerase
MKIFKNKFKDLIIFKSKKFNDERGYFRELYLEKYIKKKIIFSVVSKSKKNVLRGMHMQTKNMQGKYLSVVKGKILDVVIDCRKKSKTFGKHFKIILSDKNSTSIYIPPGFAHGFLSIDDENIVVYSCTNYRNANSEISISWNDSYLKINWPIKNPIISKKDSESSSFKNFFY